MRWVVVGAGTAGCVVAARLAESGHDVVVVEAGPDLRGDGPPDVASIDYVDTLADGERLRAIPARRTVGGPPSPYPLGRGVGGSSAVNGLLLASDDGLPPPGERAGEALRGDVDGALLAAAPDAIPATLSIAGGRRRHAGHVLDPVRHRMRVVTDRPVERVMLSGARAAGVELVDGQAIDADAVALCAGAIGTPALLLCSGVDHVPVGVGLQDHPSVTITLGLRRAGRRAPVASGAVLTRGDVQFVTMNHTTPAAAFGALTIALLSPRSRGRVALDGDGRLDVRFEQFSVDHDVARLIDGIRLARELLEHPALAAVATSASIDDHGTPIPDDDEGISAWVTRGDGPWVHAAASCPIGTVLADDGAVVGCDGLYVVDASAFASIPAAPTALPTTRLAERLAGRLIS